MSDFSDDGPALLFAYGTLGPSGDPTPDDVWRADAVRGRLYDLGPYPALVDLDDPTADWVEGHVRTVTIHELTDDLDPYEGVADGAYARVQTRTRSRLLVWVYVYSRQVPDTAVGPIPRWQGIPGRIPRGAATPLKPP